MIEPEACKTMKEVRAGVDALDERIVRLLGKRFRYMDAASRIKERRSEVRDEGRKLEVIDRVQSLAEQHGAPVETITGLYQVLVEGSIAYEMERFDSRRLKR